jgi:chromosome partitioning protein
VAAILSVANQKGGVGKTTTATTLAHAFGLGGRRVLVVDVDPQGNATSGLGAEVAARCPAFAPPGAPCSPVETAWERVWCLPAGRDLENVPGRVPTTALRDNLSRVGLDRFDVVLVDCPPSLGPLTQNALAASDGAVVPIQCEYYPLEGLVQLLAAVRLAARENPRLRVAGVVLTMYDPWADLTREVEAEVRGKLGHPVFDSVIPRDPAVAEAPSHCRSVIDYAPRSRGARAYAELALELHDRGVLSPHGRARNG